MRRALGQPVQETGTSFGQNLGQFSHLPESRGTTGQIQSQYIKITPYPPTFRKILTSRPLVVSEIERDITANKEKKLQEIAKAKQKSSGRPT